MIRRLVAALVLAGCALVGPVTDAASSAPVTASCGSDAECAAWDAAHGVASTGGPGDPGTPLYVAHPYP